MKKSAGKKEKPVLSSKKASNGRKKSRTSSEISETVGHLCQLHRLQGVLLKKLRKRV